MKTPPTITLLEESLTARIARAEGQRADSSAGNLILNILQSTQSDEGLRISGFFVETSIVNEVEYC